MVKIARTRLLPLLGSVSDLRPFVSARSELCKVLFWALSVTLRMKYIENGWTDLRQIHKEDVIDPSLVLVWRPRSTGCGLCLENIFALVLVYYGAFKPRLHDTTRCQTGCQYGLTTGCLIVQPVGQPSASCKQASNRLSIRLSTGCIV